MNWPWSALGLPGPSDLSAVRHAYAECLKTTHPEEDPEGFQRLHSAFQAASRIARQRKREDPAEHSDPAIPPEHEGKRIDLTKRSLETETDKDQTHQAPTGDSQEWDYDDLINGEEAPPKPESDWDYDQLIAEGEAERAAFRRQSLPRQEEPAFSEREARAWRDAEAALHAIENFCRMELPLAEWKRFFRGSLFNRVKDNADFIFGLEDFITRNPSLSKNVKVALFMALGLDNGVKNPLHRALYHQLVDSYHALYAPFGKGKGPVHVKEILYKVFHPFKYKHRTPVVMAVVAVMWIGTLIGLNFGGVSKPESSQDRICAYLEEDFGRPFRYRYDLEAEGQSGLFSPVDSKLVFQGEIRGKRDLENGARGYETNYAAVLLRQELERFGDAWSFPLTFNTQEGEKLTRWEAPDAYYFSIPILGAGEGIEALGTLLEELEQETWYTTMPPVFRIVLCHGSMIACDYDTDQIGGFDGTMLRAQYDAQFCYRYAGFLVKESGAPDKDIGPGAILLEQGIVQVQEDLYIWINGLDRDRTERMQYYVRVNEEKVVWEIYCVPLPGEPADDFSGYLPSTVNRLDSGDWVSCYRPRLSYTVPTASS